MMWHRLRRRVFSQQANPSILSTGNSILMSVMRSQRDSRWMAGDDRRWIENRRRTRRSRLRRPVLETLDDRILLAVDITAFNVAAGTVTFSGDQNGTTADGLLLSEVS